MLIYANQQENDGVGLIDWFIFILFCLIFDFYLFICLFFLRQKKGIHEGDT